MDIKFINPVIMVKDISVSKTFYSEVLGLKILQDAGVFVLFENHFSIHQARELQQTVFGEAPRLSIDPMGADNLLLYFESLDLQADFQKIKDKVTLIHPIVKQSWGQNVFRFYDPDRHVVEIGEAL